LLAVLCILAAIVLYEGLVAYRRRSPFAFSHTGVRIPDLRLDGMVITNGYVAPIVTIIRIDEQYQCICVSPWVVSPDHISNVRVPAMEFIL
jgi:hypothetical protein